jgi:hypothetical protein
MLRRIGSSYMQRWARQVLSSSICIDSSLECGIKSVMQPDIVSAVAIERWRQFGWLSWSGRRDISAESHPIMEINNITVTENHQNALPYKLSVVTGDVRGAGSSAPALVTLFGEGMQGIARMSVRCTMYQHACLCVCVCRWK